MEALRQTGDLERLIHRIETPSARPRDIASLRDSSFYVKRLRDAMVGSPLGGSRPRFARGWMISGISAIIWRRALVETPPVFAREGGVIREGFSPELDRLRKIQSDGRKWISELEGRERERTGHK